MTFNKFTIAIYQIAYLYIFLASRMGVPQGTGPVIMIRREAFEAINGFDEGMGAGEDTDLIRRASQVGEARYIRKTPVLVSARRLSTENPILFSFKCVIWSFCRIINSSTSIYPYRWLDHDPALADREASFLA